MLVFMPRPAESYPPDMQATCPVEQLGKGGKAGLSSGPDPCQLVLPLLPPCCGHCEFMGTQYE